MVNFKKVVAILCSATMIVAAPITAFAADTDPATSTAGDGKIVAYSFETLTVPTAVKVSFNPQGWDFTIRGTGDGATKSHSQIVSLNYGISSMATMNRKVTVSFAAEGTAGDNGGDVIFVDSKEQAEAKSADNADGAEFGEYKLYLAVAPAAAKVEKGYDTDASEVTFGVDSEHKVTSDLLSDVEMTAAQGGLQAFMPGDNDGNTSIAYKLDKAEYVLKDDAVLDFTTESADMADKVQPNKLGSIVGFTFVGAMNTNADWTKAKLSAIKITPTYEVEDADGTETAYENGGYNQITTEPATAAPSISPASYTITAGTAVEVSFSYGVGDDAATAISSISYQNASGVTKTLKAEEYSVSANKITIAASVIDNLINNSITSRTYTVTFDNDATATFTLATE